MTKRGGKKGEKRNSAPTIAPFSRYGSFTGAQSNASFVVGMKPKTDFKMFDSSTYDNGNGHDLLFSDRTYRLVEVDEGDSTYRVYLGKTWL